MFRVERKIELSIYQKVGGSILGFFSLHVEGSLGKVVNPKLIQIAGLPLCEVQIYKNALHYLFILRNEH